MNNVFKIWFLFTICFIICNCKPKVYSNIDKSLLHTEDSIELFQFVKNTALRDSLRDYLNAKKDILNQKFDIWYATLSIELQKDSTITVLIALSPQIGYFPTRYSFIGATDKEARLIVVSNTDTIVDTTSLSQRLAFEMLGEDLWYHCYQVQIEAQGCYRNYLLNKDSTISTLRSSDIWW